jgi:pimeloyl-[acyl-carrier protein] methyl ester esterase
MKLFSWFRKPDPDWREGQLFRVRTEGRGRDVVFIHGLAASAECWEGALELLGAGVRVHLVQIRGFSGLAPPSGRRRGQFLRPLAGELAGYVRERTAGRAAIVGHSMGGLAAMMTAIAEPDAVERVMVADAPAFFSSLISPFLTAGSALGLADAARRRFMAADEDLFVEGLRRTCERLVTAPEMRERVVGWSLASDRAMVADVMAEVMVTDLRADLASMRADLDVVYAHDRRAPVPRAVLDQTYLSSYARHPNCRRLRIDDARHYLMLDQPRQFYGAVGDWLAR